MAIVPGEQRGGGREEHTRGMAGPGAPDKPRVGSGWTAGGPRALAQIVASIARPALRSQPAIVARLIADWTEIVGPTLAAQTVPRRLVGGRLTLACSGPIALELQHLSGPLAERINAHAGRVLVEGFRFVPGEPALAAAPRRRRRTLVPVEIPGMAEGPLRDALAALAAAVASDQGQDDS